MMHRAYSVKFKLIVICLRTAKGSVKVFTSSLDNFVIPSAFPPKFTVTVLQVHKAVAVQY